LPIFGGDSDLTVDVILYDLSKAKKTISCELDDGASIKQLRKIVDAKSGRVVVNGRVVDNDYVFQDKDVVEFLPIMVGG